MGLLCKDLDPSYKMDLDFWECFGGKKFLSYNQRNMVDFYGREKSCSLIKYDICPKDADEFSSIDPDQTEALQTV